MFLLPYKLEIDFSVFLLAFDGDQNGLSSFSDLASVVPQDVLFVFRDPSPDQY